VCGWKRTRGECDWDKYICFVHILREIIVVHVRFSVEMKGEVSKDYFWSKTFGWSSFCVYVGAVLAFELRTSCLLGRCCTT
jgi:hypothetical protein